LFQQFDFWVRTRVVRDRTKVIGVRARDF